MKKTSEVILILFLVFIAGSCSIICYNGHVEKVKKNKNSLYYDLNCKIVSIQGTTPWTSGKFNGISKQWLLQSLRDTNKYCEYTPYSDSLFYNKKLYDTVHFDYIRKERFFTINR